MFCVLGESIEFVGGIKVWAAALQRILDEQGKCPKRTEKDFICPVFGVCQEI